MKHILFVDDEPMLLQGLKRSLWPMRHEWNMTFEVGAEEALNALKQAPIDVVVTDMRMPGMNGAQLLNEVQRRYPHIVRIILSGHSDQEMIIQSISSTHQFLAKPCEADQLKATIQRACALREILMDETLRGLVTGMSTLPSLPTLFMEIKKEVESETSSLKAVGKIIMQDIGMTAKILQLVNSAFFGFRGPISTVEQAVSFLGLDTIQSMVLACHVFSQFTVKDVATFEIDRLWQNSIKTGMLAREIAKSEGCTPLGIEQAYTAGLLHDAGILALLANLPDQFKSILAKASANGNPIFEVERSEIGITHAELGAYILRLWGLSDEIVEAVAHHHRPGECLGKTFAPVTAVHVADSLLPCPIKQTGNERASEIDTGYLDTLQLSDRVPVWKELANKTEQEAML